MKYVRIDLWTCLGEIISPYFTSNVNIEAIRTGIWRKKAFIVGAVSARSLFTNRADSLVKSPFRTQIFTRKNWNFENKSQFPRLRCVSFQEQPRTFNPVYHLIENYEHSVEAS